MKKLPDQLLDLLWGGHNIWVATVAPDGTPNVSIKGSGALLDDGQLYFADMFSHKTRENLQHDPRVSERLGKLSDKLSLPPVKYVVKIEVESVWDMGPGPHAGEELT